jgi:hypothetical protein
MSELEPKKRSEAKLKVLKRVHGKISQTTKDLPKYTGSVESDNRSVFEMTDDVTKSIPGSEWDKLPRNGSEICGNESEYLAMCPDCNFAMKYDSEKKTYHCSNCNQTFELTKT